jgi:hypothetical protein
MNARAPAGRRPPLSSAPALRPGWCRLRVLVLLLALVVPGTHAEAHAAPTAASDVVQHDGLDSALRPPSRAVHRPPAPARPSPLTDPLTAVPPTRPLPPQSRPPYTLHADRSSVVLRC